MFLKDIALRNFRNYRSARFDFSPQTTLVVGPNAVGKTNLLEAIYYLATGKSFRAGYDREVIRRSEGFSHLAGVLGRRGGVPHLRGGSECGLDIQILANENGENTSSKRFKINGVKKRLADFAGNLRAVYFGPEEILLVTGSPSRRRKYMDSVLCQVDREYARALSEYEKVLRQRNRLLLMLREKGVRGIKGVNEQMGYWDERLVSLGSVLTKKRQDMFKTINNQLSTISNLLFLGYQPRVVGRAFLEENYDREIAAGMTLWGPHRDDFKFLSSSAAPLGPRELHSIDVPLADPSVANASSDTPRRTRDLSIYGSRGEQRLAVLHLKLAELEFITARTDERPILLLDDIFSELDDDNCQQVLSLLNQQQTIITSTSAEVVNSKLKIQMSKIHLKCQN
jgi:DNA replication and repair protein RecF